MRALIPRLRRWIWCCGAVLLGGLPLLNAQSAPTAAQPVVESYQQLWLAGQSGNDTECPAHTRFYVLCYFPDWKSLWVLWDNEVHYLDAGPRPLPCKAGQWYDVRGVVRPKAQTFDWARTHLTPLPGIGGPTPTLLASDGSNLDAVSTGYAEIQGVVDDQGDLDTKHFRLNVVFGGTNATVYIGLGDGDPIPQLTGAIVRAKGVLSVKRDINDVQPKLEFWCDTPAAIKTIGFLAKDPRFALPVRGIDKVVVQPEPELVHVSGTVHRQEPGHSLILRDGTGQIKVLTRQTQPVREGEAVEAIGFPSRDGIALALRDGLFRRSVGEAPPDEVRMLLRLAEQVRTLSADAVARHTQAQVGGLVTWSAPGSPFFFIEDATGGLKVFLPKDGNASVPIVGSGVVVRGTVTPGDFAPAIVATALLPGDNIAVPDPTPISWEQAMTGAEYGSWVQMQAYVRSLVREKGECRIELIASGGEFGAILPNYDGADLTGAIVRVRGVCDAVANERRQLTGIRLLVPSAEDIQVIEPAPADPFAIPRESIGNLMRYNPTTPLNRRAQVSGVVLLQIPGRLLYVQDGSDTLTVLSRQTAPLAPGDRVALVGIPGREGGRLIMRDAVYRRLASGMPPAALVLENATARAELDGRLVRVKGGLLSREPTADGIRLQLQHDNVIFSARLEGRAEHAPDYEVGSALELTGVYQVEMDEYRHARGFALSLRSPADIVVIARPAWWTAARILWLGAALVVIAVLASAWGLVLARKNDQLQRAQRELRRANEELEGRVAERTRDLRLEVDQRRASEQTLAQERHLLLTLIDNLPVYLYVKDAEGRFAIDNLPHARLLGAQTCAEVVGKTEADFWPAELARDRRQADEIVMAAGETLLLHEEPFVTSTERRWHSTTKVPLRDAAGKVVGLIAISDDITSRKEVEADRENLHRQLLETSRQAGMAEVATGVLHNIGNVLNSVNISAAVAAETIARSRSDRLTRLSTLLTEHRLDLAAFFAHDRRGQRIPEYLEALAEQLRDEQAEVLKELKNLQKNIDHIKQVVAMQQTYAKISGVTEKVPVQDIVEDALRINGEGLARHRVRVVRDLRVNPTVVVERHKVLQILVNLISNAKYACDDSGKDEKNVTVRVEQRTGHVSIAVVDNGVGIRPENLTRIFSHGFTTRKNGHGFGLHSGAIAAKELGGSLMVYSAGIGAGATFTLEIPLVPTGASARPNVEHVARN